MEAGEEEAVLPVLEEEERRRAMPVCILEAGVCLCYLLWAHSPVLRRLFLFLFYLPAHVSEERSVGRRENTLCLHGKCAFSDGCW
jgi:hypothetical protein